MEAMNQGGRTAPGHHGCGMCMRCCSAASAPSASCSQGSSRISRGREPCRSGSVSMFAWSVRATIRSRNATSDFSATPCHGRQSSALCDGGWKAARTQRCASTAGSRNCWPHQMERRFPAYVMRTATARARRLRRTSSSTPPVAAPLRSLCCNRSTDHCRRKPRLASTSAIAITSFIQSPRRRGRAARVEWRGRALLRS